MWRVVLVPTKPEDLRFQNPQITWWAAARYGVGRNVILEFSLERSRPLNVKSHCITATRLADVSFWHFEILAQKGLTQR